MTDEERISDIQIRMKKGDEPFIDDFRFAMDKLAERYTRIAKLESALRQSSEDV